VTTVVVVVDADGLVAAAVVVVVGADVVDAVVDGVLTLVGGDKSILTSTSLPSESLYS
jgi:hypothetical protein